MYLPSLWLIPIIGGAALIVVFPAIYILMTLLDRFLSLVMRREIGALVAPVAAAVLLLPASLLYTDHTSGRTILMLLIWVPALIAMAVWIVRYNRRLVRARQANG